ncbi:MAG: hypothetical protein ACRDWN_09265, partial [Acidimicrobiales bacterium]
MKLIGGPNVIRSQITKLVAALGQAEAACAPVTDPALQQLTPLRVPTSLTAFTDLNFVPANAYAWTNAFNPRDLDDVQGIAEATTTEAGTQAVAAYATDVGYADGAPHGRVQRADDPLVPAVRIRCDLPLIVVRHWYDASPAKSGRLRFPRLAAWPPGRLAAWLGPVPV